MTGAASQRAELARYALEYAEALLDSNGHPADARAVIDRALDAGISPLRVFVDVVPQALHEVGNRWERGEISVAIEHLATGAAQDVFRDLARRLPSTDKNGRTAIVAAVEGELHELGPRVVADLLEADGWEVFYVGAATPTDALVWLTRERRPEAVVLSATLPAQLPTLKEAVARLRAERPSPFILVGGQACSGIRDIVAKVDADAYESRADLAVERLRRVGAERDRAAASESLTRREQDVLALLAQGLTNYEIAERLTISVPTIKTHVEHILRKLDLRNRSEAAAFVARRTPERRG